MCDVQVFPIKSNNHKIIDLIVGQYVTQCKHKVSYKYGKKQIENAQYAIIATKSTNTRHKGKRIELCGFLLFQIHKRYGYIDVVCSSNRMGSILIQSAEELTKSLRLPFIKLSALSHVIPYYEKKGYKHVGNPCKNNQNKIVRGSPRNGYRMTKCIL